MMMLLAASIKCHHIFIVIIIIIIIFSFIMKTRVMGLSCHVVCVILRLAVLVQYRSVTDTQTHDDGIYRA